jgi:hypothetical protein
VTTGTNEEPPRARWRSSNGDGGDAISSSSHTQNGNGVHYDDDDDGSSDDEMEEGDTFGGRISAPPSATSSPRHATAIARTSSNGSDSEEEAAEADRLRREMLERSAEAARQAADHAISEAKAAERRRIRAAQRNGTFSHVPHLSSPTSSSPSSSITAVKHPAAISVTMPNSTVSGSSPTAAEYKYVPPATLSPISSETNNGHPIRKKPPTAASSGLASSPSQSVDVTPLPSPQPPVAAPSPRPARPSSPPVPAASSSSSSSSTAAIAPTAGGGSGKPAIGGMRALANGGEEKSCWSPIDASGFKIRLGPNYAKTSKKAPSLDALYDCVGADVFKGKQSNIGARLELPPSPGITVYQDLCSINNFTYSTFDEIGSCYITWCYHHQLSAAKYVVLVLNPSLDLIAVLLN